jgi:hypothetical protein
MIIKTVGELIAALQGKDPNAPILTLYDDHAGVSDRLAVVDPGEDDRPDWAEPNTVYLDVSYNNLGL